MIKFVKVIKTEEKGSDVNLAIHILNDAWKGLYESAIVISNDSDLAEAFRIVNKDLGKSIGLLIPQEYKPSKELLKYSTFYKPIRKGPLAQSQLPDRIPGTTIHKPKVW